MTSNTLGNWSKFPREAQEEMEDSAGEVSANRITLTWHFACCWSSAVEVAAPEEKELEFECICVFNGKLACVGHQKMMVGEEVPLCATVDVEAPPSPKTQPRKLVLSPSPATRRQLFSMEQWHVPFPRTGPPRAMTKPASPLSKRIKVSKRFKLVAIVCTAIAAVMFSLFTMLNTMLIVYVGFASTALMLFTLVYRAREKASIVDNIIPFEAHHAQTVPSRMEFISRCLLTSQQQFISSLTTAMTSCVDLPTLTQFKSHLDVLLREQGQSLHQVVFESMCPKQRDILLHHFAAVKQESNEQQQVVKRLVISDIDDTLMPSLKDRRGFAGGAPYPGVSTFLSELATGEANQVSFVTARPAILRKWTRSEIAKCGFANALLLMGTARTATSPSGMLQNKLKQAREMRMLWPECEIVLVGDNGQRDIDLGKALLNEQLAEAVFIHDIYFDGVELPPKTELMVLEEQGELQRTASGLRVIEPSLRAGFRQDECGEVGINLFPSYAAAAVMAKQKGLLNSHQLELVARACAQEFGQRTHSRRLGECLLRDVGRVVHELDHFDDVQRVEFLRFIHEAIENPAPGLLLRAQSIPTMRRMTSSTLSSSHRSSYGELATAEQISFIRACESSPDFAAVDISA